MGFYLFSLFCFLSLACLGFTSNRHMICKDVDDVFNAVKSNDVYPKRLVGPRGAAGSKGERGFPGLKGEPSVIDPERLKEIVRASVDEETRERTKKIIEMQAKIQDLSSELNLFETCNGKVYNGTCYWADVYYTQTINLAEAQTICQKRNLTLADIHGQVHYKVIMEYLRTKLYGKEYIVVWTAMKKLYNNPVAWLSNGNEAPYTKQRSEAEKWDIAEEKRTHVYLLARAGVTNSDQGMGAYWPTGDLHGVLCKSL